MDGLAVCFCHKDSNKTVSKMKVMGMISCKGLTQGGCNFKFTYVVVGKIQSFVDFWTEVTFSHWRLAGDLPQFIAM